MFVGEKPFKCPFEGCNQAFTTSNIRKVHIRTHTGERPFVCDYKDCKKSFASATNYKNHMRIHSGTEAEEFELCVKFVLKGFIRKTRIRHGISSNIALHNKVRIL